MAPLFCGLGVVVHVCFDDHVEDCHHELECETDPCQILILAASHRNDEYFHSDDTSEQMEQPLLRSAVFIPASGHFSLFCPGAEAITELIESQRSLPLIC